MDMLGEVRRMRMRDSISISAIAKRTGLARNTIKKWLKAPGCQSHAPTQSEEPRHQSQRWREKNVELICQAGKGVQISQ